MDQGRVSVLVVDSRPLTALRLEVLAPRRLRLLVAKDAESARDLAITCRPLVVAVALSVDAPQAVALLQELCESRAHVASVLVTRDISTPLRGRVDLILAGSGRFESLIDLLAWLDGTAWSLRREPRLPSSPHGGSSTGRPRLDGRL